MPKRRRRLSPEARAASDLMTISLFAPVVVASRLSMLAEEAWRPSAAGRRESVRMVAEKPVAAIEAAGAMQRAMAKAGFEMGRAMFEASLAPLKAGAAMRPVSRRVHANAKRLARKPARRAGSPS